MAMQQTGDDGRPLGRARSTSNAVERHPPMAAREAARPSRRTERTARATTEALPMADDPLLTDDDVAERLGVSPRTVRRWRRKGLLPFVKAAGTVRIRQSDYDRTFRPRGGGPDPPGEDRDRASRPGGDADENP
ncbi:MAG: helix-turn-helix domain-containing protein [Acetobacteraceae bacterium]|nr:helix-turn-helix domain-containing protein [Acetobacteraceae bacterium]